MKLLITGCCGHIGSYLVNNIHKINKIKKTIIIDNFNPLRSTHYLILIKKIVLNFINWI